MEITIDIPKKLRLKLAHKLEKLKEKRQLGFNQLALKAGINAKSLNLIMNGETKRINPFQLKKIAYALRVDYKELYKIVGYLDEDDFGSSETTLKVNEVKFLDTKVVELPVYGKVSAGNGHINLENIIKYKKALANGFGPDSFFVEVTGNSMAHVINDGDFAIVDPQLKDYIQDKVYVVTYNDETFIKQVKCPRENMVVLRSFNSEYDDKYIVDDQIKDLKIEGRVVKIISERNI